MAKHKILLAIIAVMVVMVMCFGVGCDKAPTQDESGSNTHQSDTSGDKTSDNPSEEGGNSEEDPKPEIPTHIDEVEATGLNVKTVSIKGGETYNLSDYEITLPTTDCNFFFAEMLVSSWPCNLTMKVTDVADENNYFVINAKVSKRVAEREGEEIDGPDGMLEFTYQKAGGEESEEMATILAYWEDYASGGTTQDSFTGYIIQWEYKGGSEKIGCFNVGSSFVSTDGFSAEKVTVSLSSDVDVKVGLRYFGDTLNWDLDLKSEEDPEPEIPTHIDEVEATGLNVKTVSIKGGETYNLSDYEITLPTTDCNFFFAEMLVSSWPCNLTMKVTDVADENNYFVINAKVSKRVAEREGEEIDGPDGMLEFTYQKAGGEESEEMATILAYWEDYASGGTTQDSFTGYIIQWEYKGGSEKIGCFNVGSSFVSTDGFSAEKVTVSLSSDVDVKVGLRYFGDTLNWDHDLKSEVPDPVGTLEVKTVKLEAGATYTLTDYPVTLPATDCNFFLAEMYVSNNANIVMRVADKDNSDNYFELNLKLEGNNLTMSYKKAGGEASKECTTVLASAENVGSGGSVADVFTGKTIQLVFNGSSRNIGVFNVPDTFIGLDGFEASGVVVSFTSDAAVNIGLRYFGDTLDWRTE